MASSSPQLQSQHCARSNVHGSRATSELLVMLRTVVLLCRLFLQ